MREILFRGKRLDTGCWVTGYLLKVGNIAYILCPDAEQKAVGICYVDPSTVGQYIGQADKNDITIYEGDIVTFKRHTALGYVASRVGDVRYYDALPIYYIMATTGDAWDWVDCEEIEVIGNIHDNPELLAKEAGK